MLSLSSLYFYWHSTITRIPTSIPWAGVKDEAFSKPRAWIREFFAGSSTLLEGYFTVSSLLVPPRFILFFLFEILVKYLFWG